MIFFWILPLAVILHIIEEFGFPGGFRIWYQNYKPSFASSLTNKFLISINTILIFLCILPIFIGLTPQGVALWLTIIAILFFNSFFHIIGSIRTNRYSPGMITSIVLYIPLTVWGYWFFLSTKQASIGTTIIAFCLGSFYQWWSTNNHKRRTKTKGNNN